MQARAKTAGITPKRTVLCFGRGFVGDRHNVDSLNESGQTRRLLDVRFGSVAAYRHRISSTAAIERIPDARLRFPGSPYLTGRFHQERSFKTLSNQQNDRPHSANSGHYSRSSSCCFQGISDHPYEWECLNLPNDSPKNAVPQKGQ